MTAQPNNAPSLSFTSAFTASAVRRIAVACGKSRVRKIVVMFGRINKSGAAPARNQPKTR